MPTRNFIVAIELCSTKIIGVAGQRNNDGSFTIIAAAKEDATSCIRKGVVYNSDKTVQCINSIINKLKTTLKSEISQVYVGVGGLSIHSKLNTIVDDLDRPTIVTPSMINNLMDTNRAVQYKDYEILDVATLEYKVDSQYQKEPVGIECSKLEGNFLNIVQRKKYYKALDNCFAKAGVKIAEMYLAPIAMADAVLTDAEKRNGCVLIDMGAETTTILVYHKDLLRHIAVLPIGGANVTKDILSFQMEEEEAEKIKLAHASAFTETEDIDSSITYKLSDGREIDSRKFINIVESRVQEIVQNALYQIPSDLSEKLVGGIVITGGMSNMKNIEQAFTQNTKDNYKIRKASFVNSTVHTNNIDVISRNGMTNTVLGLLLKGDLNCAGQEIIQQKSIFTEEPQEEDSKSAHTESEQTGIGKVKVSTAEKPREQKIELDTEKEDTPSEPQVEAPKEPKQKKSTMISKLKNWFFDFTAPDE